jgi:hypothetical protein
MGRAAGALPAGSAANEIGAFFQLPWPRLYYKEEKDPAIAWSDRSVHRVDLMLEHWRWLHIELAGPSV